MPLALLKIHFFKKLYSIIFKIFTVVKNSGYQSAFAIKYIILNFSFRRPGRPSAIYKFDSSQTNISISTSMGIRTISRRRHFNQCSWTQVVRTKFKTSLGPFKVQSTNYNFMCMSSECSYRTTEQFGSELFEFGTTTTTAFQRKTSGQITMQQANPILQFHSCFSATI